MNTPRALVIGLGNVLMGDDAFGPSVAEALEASFDFPPGVTVLDGGTPGLNLMPLMMDYEVLIVVDTVKSKGHPGEIRLYRKEDLSPTARAIPVSPALPVSPTVRATPPLPALPGSPVGAGHARPVLPEAEPPIRSPRQGPHEPGLDEVLTALDLAGRAPSEVLLVGVIPESVDTGTGMTDALRAAIPAAIRVIQDELWRFNLAPTAKPGAETVAPAPWWAAA